MLRSISLRVCVFCALLAASSWAQALVFAVNEGVSYRVSNEEIRARYAAMAVDLSRLLRQPVTVLPVGDYTSLRAGLNSRAFDLALVHPAHVSIAAMKQQNYRLVAVAKGFDKYQANFLVRADSPLQTLADLNGRRLGAPDEDSITAWMVRATLRDAQVNLDKVSLTYTRYQDAVPFFVDNSLTHAGATAAASLIKDWQAKGGKVLARSKVVPIKHMIASPTLSTEQVAAVRDYLLALDGSDEGRKKLEPSKLRGFMAYDSAQMLALGQWLGL
jgi:phosphonate transport system substrate-binding protein